MTPRCNGYEYCTTSFNKASTQGSAQVQILLAACQRFSLVRIFDNGPWLEIGPNLVRRSAIPQKQFIVIITIRQCTYLSITPVIEFRLTNIPSDGCNSSSLDKASEVLRFATCSIQRPRVINTNNIGGVSKNVIGLRSGFNKIARIIIIS